LREQRAAQQQAMMEAQAELQQAEAAGKAAPAIKALKG